MGVRGDELGGWGVKSVCAVVVFKVVRENYCSMAGDMLNRTVHNKSISINKKSFLRMYCTR